MPMPSNLSYVLDEVETGNKRITIKTSEASLESERYLLGVKEWVGHSFSTCSTWYFAEDICPYVAAEGLGKDEILDGVRLV